MNARNKRNSFVEAALCALLLSVCCLRANAEYFDVNSSKFCYSNNYVTTLSGVFSDVITPKTITSFWPSSNDFPPVAETKIVYTANPPQGYMLARTGPNWVIVNELTTYGFNWETTPNLDDLMRDKKNICIAYTNVGYFIEVKFSDLKNTNRATVNMVMAPCFEWLKYDLHYDKNLPYSHGVDQTITSGNIIYTNTVTLASRPSDWSSDDYSFKGLSLSSNATVASFQFGQTITSAGATFNAKTNGVDWTKNGVVTLYGVWTPQYKVYFNGNGGMAPEQVTEIGPTNYDYGVTWQLPSNPFAKANNEFVGWSTNQNASADEALLEGTSVSNLTDVPGGTVRFYAIWRSVVYHDATFAWQNDDGETNVVVSVREGDCVEVPIDVDANAWTGRSFVCWEPDPETTPITSNTVFTAHYTNNLYEVVFDANGGEGGITNNLDYASTIVPPMVTRVGSSFVAWEPEPDETVPASNVCYVAQYTNNIYEVVFDANGGEGGKTVTQDYGTALSAPTVTRTGYTFTGWSPSVPSTVPAANVTYTAQWQIKKFMVTFDANGGNGGLVTNLEYNAAIPSAPEVTKEGWSFVAWEPKPESVGTVPASNVTFTAQWSEDIFYNADFVYYDGNVVVTNRSRVKENSKVTVPADFNPEARIGYSFFGWDPPNPANTPIVSDTVFTAQYTNNVYEVVFDANGGAGGITNYLDYASTIEPPMVTREGCSFVSWEPEPDETVPASNVCYVAQYTNNIYEVVFDAGYDGGIRVVTNLEFGSEMPQPPTVARDGWNFVAWVPELDDTVPASNVCYIAIWEEEVITYGDLATAADANFELTRVERPGIPGSWSVDSNVCVKGESSIKAEMPDTGTYSICITGVVHGAGSISFKARSDSNLQYQEQNGSMLKPGLRFGYGTNPSMPEKWMSPEPPTNNEWNEFTIQIGEKASDVTLVWWYVYQGEYEEDDDLKISPFNVWIDEIKWTPATGPTEADRPVVSGFTASPGGGFTLSISNASPSFEYVVQTNTTLRTDAIWGEMKRVSGDQAGSIELERPAGVPSLFYRVGVEAK